MAEPIAFVTRLPAADEADWIAALSREMPAESILPLRDIGDTANVRIAIVADPDPRELRRLKSLAWIQSLWAGVDRLVGELGPDAPPIVRLVDPELARIMGEAVLAWTYYLWRDMPTYARQQRERLWRPLPYRPPSSGTVGLLGLGAMGAAAAGRLAEAGFKVEGWSRSPKTLGNVRSHSGEDGLNELLGRADIVVCLLPLTEETRGLLDADRLSGMQPGAALINFGRGPIVVADALLAALDAGRLSHAVLDVFEQEPLPPNSLFWSNSAVTVLPHISAPTSRGSAAAVAGRNVKRYRETGVAPGHVDRARGY
jgi:glyoxylate/hydroxypyruvate reductase A